MRVLSHGGTANASESHGSREISVESSLRLPDHTDNVRPQNSAVTAGHATSQPKLQRTGSKIRDSQIPPDGRGSNHRAAWHTIPTERPGIRTIPRTRNATLTGPT